MAGHGSVSGSVDGNSGRFVNLPVGRESSLLDPFNSGSREATLWTKWTNLRTMADSVVQVDESAKTLRSANGTNQIQRVVVARHLLN